MQPRIPLQPAHEPAGRRAGDDAGPGDVLAAVVAGARRRAVRDGDRQVDTAHLLHSLVESDPDVFAALGDGPYTARLLGYLVQRSIGYGLRWQGLVEECGTLPPAPAGTDTEGWSPLAAAAMELAGERALLRGENGAHGIDLLVALVSDPGARAVEVLARAGLDARELLVMVGESGARGAAAAPPPDEFAAPCPDAPGAGG